MEQKTQQIEGLKKLHKSWKKQVKNKTKKLKVQEKN